LSFKKKKMTELERVIQTKDCDNLISFLEKYPQTDKTLWKNAAMPLRRDCADELVLVLLQKIQTPSEFEASKYIIDLVYNGLIKCAEYVLDTFPVDVNYKDEVKGSVLTIAVRHSHTEFALMLMDIPGIDLNVTNCNKRNPVWFAAANHDKVVLDKLLELGAQTLEVDAENTLPEERTTDELAFHIRNNQDLGINELALL